MPLPNTPYILYANAWEFITGANYAAMRALLLNSGTLTSDAPVTISQTWNNAAVAFTGLKVNAAGTSGTNSASGSLLADFQLNGVSQASVNKSGNLTVVGYLAANGGNSFLSGTTLRIGNSNGDINLSGGSLIVPSTTAPTSCIAAPIFVTTFLPASKAFLPTSIILSLVPDILLVKAFITFGSLSPKKLSSHASFATSIANDIS